MINPNPHYYDQANQHLLRLLRPLPSGALLIVETGCGAGALGREYKRINPNACYVGLEAVPQAAAKAAKVLDRVVVGNAEHLDAAACGLEEGSVDCLVYGDVLEHMIDPWTLLQRQARWLKEDGLVLASIPNIGHWSVLFHLLRDEWPYADAGLFDRTHLRFFTLEGIQALFTRAGLHVADVQFVESPAPGFQEFLKHLTPVIKAMRGSVPRFQQRIRAFQYLVRAERSPPQGRVPVQPLTTTTPRLPETTGG